MLSANADQIMAGYGITYLFGVLGVVLFVQILPKVLKVDMENEKIKKAVCIFNGIMPAVCRRLLQKEEASLLQKG